MLPRQRFQGEMRIDLVYNESFRGHGSINAKCLARAFISLRAVRKPRGAAPHRVGSVTPVLVAPAHGGHVLSTRRKSTGMKIKI